MKAKKNFRTAASKAAAKYSRDQKALLSAFLAALAVVPAAQALDWANASVVHGNIVGKTENGGTASGVTTVVQGSVNGIIDWNGVNLVNKEVLNLLNGAAGQTLIRDTSNQASQILGKINATGSLWVVNKAGVFIGSTAAIDVGRQFLAAAGDITNDNFLNGTVTFTDVKGEVWNVGKITAGDDVLLVGAKVTNQGTITAADQIAFGAGLSNKIDVATAKGGKISFTIDKAAPLPSPATALTNGSNESGTAADNVVNAGTLAIKDYTGKTVQADTTTDLTGFSGKNGTSDVTDAKVSVSSGTVSVKDNSESVLVDFAETSNTQAAKGANTSVGTDATVKMVAAGDIRLDKALSVAAVDIDLQAAGTLESKSTLSGKHVTLTGANGLELGGNVTAAEDANVTGSATQVSSKAINITAGGALATKDLNSVQAVTLTGASVSSQGIVKGTRAAVTAKSGNATLGKVEATAGSISVAAKGTDAAAKVDAFTQAGTGSVSIQGNTVEVTQASTAAGAVSLGTGGATSVTTDAISGKSIAIGQTAANTAVTAGKLTSADGNVTISGGTGDVLVDAFSQQGAGQVAIYGGNVTITNASTAAGAVNLGTSGGTSVTTDAITGKSIAIGKSGATTGAVTVGALETSDGSVAVYGKSVALTGDIAAKKDASGTKTVGITVRASEGAVTGGKNLTSAGGVNVNALGTDGSVALGAIKADGAVAVKSEQSAVTLGTTEGASVGITGKSVALSGNVKATGTHATITATEGNVSDGGTALTIEAAQSATVQATGTTGDVDLKASVVKAATTKVGSAKITSTNGSVSVNRVEAGTETVKGVVQVEAKNGGATVGTFEQKGADGLVAIQGKTINVTQASTAAGAVSLGTGGATSVTTDAITGKSIAIGHRANTTGAVAVGALSSTDGNVTVYGQSVELKKNVSAAKQDPGAKTASVTVEASNGAVIGQAITAADAVTVKATGGDAQVGAIEGASVGITGKSVALSGNVKATGTHATITATEGNVSDGGTALTIEAAQNATVQATGTSGDVALGGSTVTAGTSATVSSKNGSATVSTINGTNGSATVTGQSAAATTVTAGTSARVDAKGGNASVTEIAANAGNVNVTATESATVGKFTQAGTGSVAISGKTVALTGGDTSTAAGNLTVTSAEGVTKSNGGTIEAANVTIRTTNDAAGIALDGGKITAGTNAIVNATKGAVTGSGNIEATTGLATVTGATGADVTAVKAGTNATVTATAGDATVKDIAANNGKVVVSAAAGTATVGTFVQGTNTAADAVKITGANVELNGTTESTAAGGVQLLATGDTVNGKITTGAGAITAAGNVMLAKNGSVAAAGDITLGTGKISGVNVTVKSAATVAGNGDLDATTGAATVIGGTGAEVNAVKAGTDATVTATLGDATVKDIAANNGNVAVSAATGTVTVTKFTQKGTGAVTITGSTVALDGAGKDGDGSTAEGALTVTGANSVTKTGDGDITAATVAIKGTNSIVELDTGTIKATTGDATVTAGTSVTATGIIDAAKNATVTGATGAEVATVKAGTDATVTATTGLTKAETVEAGGNAKVEALGGNALAGTITGTSGTATVAGTLSASATTMTAGTDALVKATAGNANAHAITAGTNATVQSDTATAEVTGSMIAAKTAAGAATVKGKDVNVLGSVTAGTDATKGSVEVTAADDGTAKVAGAVIQFGNDAGTEVAVKGGTVIQSGTITAAGDVELAGKAGGVASTAAIDAKQNLKIAADGGKITTSDDNALTGGTGVDITTTTSGDIALGNGKMTATTGNATVTAAGAVTGAGDITASAADGDVTVTGATGAEVAAVKAGKDATVTATAGNAKAGAVEAGNDATVTANGTAGTEIAEAGTITAGKDATVEATSGTAKVTTAMTAAATTKGKATVNGVNAEAKDITAGTGAVDGQVEVTATNAATVTGTIAQQGTGKGGVADAEGPGVKITGDTVNTSGPITGTSVKLAGTTSVTATSDILAKGNGTATQDVTMVDISGAKVIVGNVAAADKQVTDAEVTGMGSQLKAGAENAMASGNVKIEASGTNDGDNVTLNGSVGGNNVNITAKKDVDGAGNILAGKDADVTATNIKVTGSIKGENIKNTVSGNIEYTGTTPVAHATHTLNLKTTGGHIKIDQDAISETGDVILTTTDATKGDITVGKNVTANSTGTGTASGNVTITSAKGVTIGGDVTATKTNATGKNANVIITADQTIDITGNVTAQAGDVTMVSDKAGIKVGNTIDAQGGDVKLTAVAKEMGSVITTQDVLATDNIEILAHDGIIIGTGAATNKVAAETGRVDIQTQKGATSLPSTTTGDILVKAAVSAGKDIYVEAHNNDASALVDGAATAKAVGAGGAFIDIRGGKGAGVKGSVTANDGATNGGVYIDAGKGAAFLGQDAAAIVTASKIEVAGEGATVGTVKASETVDINAKAGAANLTGNLQAKGAVNVLGNGVTAKDVESNNKIALDAGAGAATIDGKVTGTGVAINATGMSVTGAVTAQTGGASLLALTPVEGDVALNGNGGDVTVGGGIAATRAIDVKGAKITLGTASATTDAAKAGATVKLTGSDQVTANGAITGETGVEVIGKGIEAGAVTATTNNVVLDGLTGDVKAEALTATGTAASVDVKGGKVTVGAVNATTDATLNASGAGDVVSAEAGTVTVKANKLTIGAVKATTGAAVLDAGTGALTLNGAVIGKTTASVKGNGITGAQAITAEGGALTVDGRSEDVTVGALTAADTATVTAQGAVTAGDIAADGDVTVKSVNKSATVGNITGKAGTGSAASAAVLGKTTVTTGAVSATGDVQIAGETGLATIGGAVTGKAVTVSGVGIAANGQNITAMDALKLDGKAGNVTAGALNAGNNQLLQVNGAAVTVGAIGGTAGQAIVDIDATGTATLDTVTANAVNVKAVGIEAANKAITANNGNIVLNATGTTVNVGDLTANAGKVDVDAASAATLGVVSAKDVNVKAVGIDAGTNAITASNGNIVLNGQAGAVSAGALTAEAGLVDVDAAQAVTLAGATKAQAVNLAGQSVTAQDVTATAGNAVLTAAGGNVKAGAVDASEKIALNAANDVEATTLAAGTDVEVGGEKIQLADVKADRDVRIAGIGAATDDTVTVGALSGKTGAKVRNVLVSSASTKVTTGKVSATNATLKGAGVAFAGADIENLLDVDGKTALANATADVAAGTVKMVGEGVIAQAVTANAGDLTINGKAGDVTTGALAGTQLIDVDGKKVTIDSVAGGTTATVQIDATDTATVTNALNAKEATVNGKGIALGATTVKDAFVVNADTGAATLNGDVSAASVDVKGASVAGQALTATNGKVTLNATGTTVNVGKISTTGEDGSVTVIAKTDATTGEITTNSGKNASVMVIAKDGAAKTENILAFGENANVKVEGKTSATVANVYAGKNVVLDANDGTVNAGTTVQSKQGNIAITAKNDVALAGSATLEAENGNIDVKAGNSVTSANNLVILYAKQANVTAEAGSIAQMNGELDELNADAKTGDIVYTELPAGKDVTLGKVNAQGGSVTVTANDGSVAAKDVAATAGVIVTATSGDITVGKIVSAGQKVTLKATNSIAKDGNGTNVTAGTLNATADTGAIDLNTNVATATLSGEKGVKIVETDGVTLKGVTANTGAADIANKAGDITLDGAVAADTVDVKAAGELTATAAGTVTADVGAVKMTAGDAMTLAGAVTGATDVELNAAQAFSATADINAQGGKAAVTAGDTLTVAGVKATENVELNAVKTITANGDITADAAVIAKNTDAAADIVLNKNVTAKTDVTLDAGQNMTVAANQTVKATDGFVDIDAVGAIDAQNTVAGTYVDMNAGTTIAAVATEAKNGDVNLTGKTGVTATGVTKATAGKVAMTAENGAVKAAQIDADTDVILKAKTTIDTAATTAGNNVDFNAGGKITAADKTWAKAGAVTATSTADAINVKEIDAQTDVTLTAAKTITANGVVTAGKAFKATAQATDADVLINANATAGTDVALKAGQNVTVADGAIVKAAAGFVDINATKAIVAKTTEAGTNVNMNAGTTVEAGTTTANAGDVTLTGKDGVTTTGVTTAKGGKVAMTAENGAIDAQAKIDASAGTDVILKANGKISAAQVDAKQNVTMTSTTDAINANGTVTATDGDVNLTAKTTIDATKTTAGNDVAFNAGGTVITTDLTWAKTGKVIVKSADAINAAAIKAGTDVALNAVNDITANGTIDAAAGFITAKTTTGDILIKDNATAKTDVTLDSAKDIAITDGKTVKATAGFVDVDAVGKVALANTTAGTYVDVNAGDTLTTENVTQAGTDVIFLAKNKVWTKGTVDATAGSLKVVSNAADIDVDGAVTVGKNITLNAEKRVDTTDASLVKAKHGYVNVLAANGPVALKDTEASTNVDVVAKTSINAGTTTAGENVTLNAGGDIITTGKTTATTGSVTATSTAHSINVKEIEADKDVTLTSRWTIDTTKTTAGNNVTFNAGETITTADATKAGTNVVLNAVKTITANGTIDAAAGAITANTTDAAGDIVINDAATAATDVTIDSAKDVSVKNGKTVKATAGFVDVDAVGKAELANTEAGTYIDAVAGDTLTATGNTKAATDVTLTAQNKVWTKGTVDATAGSLKVVSNAADIDVDGAVTVGKNITLNAETNVDTTGAALIKANSGFVNVLAKTGTANLNATEAGTNVDVVAKTAINANTTTATDNVTLTADGKIATTGKTTATAGAVTATSTADAIDVKEIEASTDVALTAKTTIDTTKTTAGNNVTFNADGTVTTSDLTQATNGKVIVKSADAINAAAIKAGTDVALNAVNDITANGTIDAAAGFITAKTTTGDILIKDNATAQTDITLDSAKGIAIDAGKTVHAKDGFVDVDAVGKVALANTTAGTYVDVNAGDTLTTENATQAGTDVIFLAKNKVETKGTVEAGNNVKVTSAAEDIAVDAAMTAGNNVVLAAQKAITTGTAGTVTATAGDATLRAKTGNVTLGAKLDAVAGDVTVAAEGADILVNAAVEAANNVTLAAKNNVTADTNGTLTAETGDVAVMAETQAVKLDAAVQADQNIGVTAGTSVTTGAAGTLTADNGNINVLAKNADVTIGAKADAVKGNVALTAEQANVAVNGAVEAAQNVDLAARQAITTADTVTAENGNVKMTAQTGDITTDAAVEATQGNVGMHAMAANANVNAAVKAGQNIGVTAGTSVTTGVAGTLTADNGNIDILAKNGDVTIGAKAEAVKGDVDITALGATAGSALINGDVVAGESVRVTTDGFISATANVTAKTAKVGETDGLRFLAKNDGITTSPTATLTAEKSNVVLKAENNGDITLNGAVNAGRFNTTPDKGNVVVDADRDVTISNTVIANNSVDVKATRDVTTTTNGNVMANSGNVTMIAGNDIAAAGTTTAGETVSMTAAKHVTVDGAVDAQTTQTGPEDGIVIRAKNGTVKVNAAMQALASAIRARAEGAAGDIVTTANGKLTAKNLIDLDADRNVDINALAHATDANSRLNVTARKGDITTAVTDQANPLLQAHKAELAAAGKIGTDVNDILTKVDELTATAGYDVNNHTPIPGASSGIYLIQTDGDWTLKGIRDYGNGNVLAYNKNGLTIVNGEILNKQGNILLRGNGDITLKAKNTTPAADPSHAATITAETGAVNVIADNGTVTMEADTAVTAAKDVLVRTENGNVVMDGAAKVTAKDAGTTVVVDANGDIQFGEVKADKRIHVAATGNVTTAANLADGAVNLTAKDVSLDVTNNVGAFDGAGTDKYVTTAADNLQIGVGGHALVAEKDDVTLKDIEGAVVNKLNPETAGNGSESFIDFTHVNVGDEARLVVGGKLTQDTNINVVGNLLVDAKGDVAQNANTTVGRNATIVSREGNLTMAADTKTQANGTIGINVAKDLTMDEGAAATVIEATGNVALKAGGTVKLDEVKGDNVGITAGGDILDNQTEPDVAYDVTGKANNLAAQTTNITAKNGVSLAAGGVIGSATTRNTDGSATQPIDALDIAAEGNVAAKAKEVALLANDANGNLNLGPVANVTVNTVTANQAATTTEVGAAALDGITADGTANLMARNRILDTNGTDVNVTANNIVFTAGKSVGYKGDGTADPIDVTVTGTGDNVLWANSTTETTDSVIVAVDTQGGNVDPSAGAKADSKVVWLVNGKYNGGDKKFIQSFRRAFAVNGNNLPLPLVWNDVFGDFLFLHGDIGVRTAEGSNFIPFLRPYADVRIHTKDATKPEGEQDTKELPFYGPYDPEAAEAKAAQL